MNELPELIDRLFTWLSLNASLTVAAGSALLALILLWIDSRLAPLVEDETADVATEVESARELQEPSDEQAPISAESLILTPLWCAS